MICVLSHNSTPQLIEFIYQSCYDETTKIAVNPTSHFGAILLSAKLLFSLELPYPLFHGLSHQQRINQTACILLGSKCHSYENCPHYPCKSNCKAPSWDTLISHCFRIKL